MSSFWRRTRHYPDPSRIDPVLLGFSGGVGSDGNRLAKLLPSAFSDPSVAEKEQQWNEGEEEIVEGIASLVPNYPPGEGNAYVASEVRLFLQMAGLQQLAMRAKGFTERVARGGTGVGH